MRILFIGGDDADEAALRGRLAKAGPNHALTRVDRAGAAGLLKLGHWDLILADARLPGLTGDEVCGLVRQSGQQIPVVVVGDADGEAATVAWLEQGVFDFITRPDFAGLWPLVTRVDQEWKQRGSTAALLALAKSRTFGGSDFDAALKEILEAGTASAGTVRAGIWAFDRPAGVLRNLQQLDRRDGSWSSGLELKFSDFPDYFRALEEEQQIVADDARADPRTGALTYRYLAPGRVTALLDTGVRIGGELKGILCLEDGSGTRRWSAGDQVFAAALAEVTALVFEGAERLRAEERAEDSEGRFRELFHYSRDVIILYRVAESGEMRAEDVNPAALELVGLPLEAVLGKTPSEVLPKEVAEAMTQRHLEVLESRQPAMFEQLLALPFGDVWVNTALVPFLDKQGRVHRIAAIARNVTEQRQLEAQLAQSRTLEALGRLAGNVAHDFNNLLAGVSGWAGRLTGSPDPEARESGEQILQAVIRARELTRQVLTFGQRELPMRKPLNLTQLVAETVKLLEPSLRPEVRVQVHAELQAEGTMALGDPGQLHQVVLNLCTNAVQAMAQGGKLTVRLEPVEVSAEFANAHPPLREGHHLRLQVEDTGTGMPPEVLGRVFEPFFTTKGPGVGTGLGLAVVHGIVQAHGGALEVRSVAGEGTTFEVFLPSLSSAGPDGRPGKGAHILLVDDQLNVLRASAILFEQLGYRTTAFTDPSEALAAFRSAPQQFDLVLTDLSMPQMSGRQLAQAVHAVRADLPVIVTTGRDLSEEDLRAFGIHAVLQKPWRVEDAMRALRGVRPAG